MAQDLSSMLLSIDLGVVPDDLVGLYVDACHAAGATAIPRGHPARIGAEVKTLRAAGTTDEVIAKGILDIARRNASPAMLASVVGDVERHERGTPRGRVLPPALIVPSENPVDVRDRARRAHIAELRAQEAIDAG